MGKTGRGLPQHPPPPPSPVILKRVKVKRAQEVRDNQINNFSFKMLTFVVYWIVCLLCCSVVPFLDKFSPKT